MNLKYKQFVIVPRHPWMSPGKIASQVAHATFEVLHKQSESIDGRSIIESWRTEGMCVIVLQCNNQVELMNLSRYCDQWNVINHLYIDEGLTEVPAGTATAFATGILTEDKWWMFEKLKLYR